MQHIDEATMDLLFREARTFSAWQQRPVQQKLLEDIYHLARLGPTSMNGSPLRIVFVTTPEGKEKLKPCLMQGNVAKTMQAPVTAIFCHDLAFYERMDYLWPHSPARQLFEGKPAAIETFALRNGTLSAAYFMLAARSLGLDCGPMSGFDNAAVDEAFLTGTSWKSNFLCNLGYGDRSKLHPRGPRLDFAEAARIV
jgi:3-hydroxypropanoate dehydrogenase